LWGFKNRAEMTGGWRKLRNVERHDLCCS